METPVVNSNAELTDNVEPQSVITSDVVDQNHHNAVSSPPNDRYIFYLTIFECLDKLENVMSLRLLN